MATYCEYQGYTKRQDGCFQIYSLVRICYANLTIQFETLLCFAASFYDTFFAQDNIRGIAGAYISSASATEHEISIHPEYGEKLMAHKI